MSSKVPLIRIRAVNRAPIRADGKYVLYWMIANRRLRHNFALDRALEHCHALGKPLLVFEALRVAYRWASDRLHRFVIDGMADNANTCAAYGVRYFPYIEPRPNEGKGLLAALAADACAVVTDEFPCFFLPCMVAGASKQLPVLLEAIDSNGLLPIYATDHASLRAFDFRRILQKELPQHLLHFPHHDPLRKQSSRALATIPATVLARWPMASSELLSRSAAALSRLPIDHSVPPTALRGGSKAASSHMQRFLRQRFPNYLQSRNDPDHDVTSGLSPYLHFGHLSAHELFTHIARHEHWTLEKLSLRANGSRKGWWNMSPAGEAFLDQLITWRELGYNFTSHRADYDRYDSLANWARGTLQKHLRDEREHLYMLDQFESAHTHDPLWNAAQTQLVGEGRIHNYLRMLWGKKILEWSSTPQEALQIMIHLNNKYGLDGRNPNSYSGIFWVFGRFDRPWAPEHPVSGTVRYMSSANTALKTHVKAYLQKFTSVPPRDLASLPLFETLR